MVQQETRLKVADNTGAKERIYRRRYLRFFFAGEYGQKNYRQDNLHREPAL